MYIEARPIGCTPLSDDDRQPIVQVVSGDQWDITCRIVLQPDTACTPKNSRLDFVLSETRFSRSPYWRGGWNQGIEPLDDRGLVRVRIPRDISDQLRRGSYSFSLSAQDLLGQNRNTTLIGTLLVEYQPGSPNHSIPYRRTQWGELDDHPNHRLCPPYPPVIHRGARDA